MVFSEFGSSIEYHASKKRHLSKFVSRAIIFTFSMLCLVVSVSVLHNF